MKLIYCTHSLYNPGGMERVLLNKVAWLKTHTDWDIMIVTTDQHHRPTFFPVPDGVRMADLGINYSDDNYKSPVRKIAGYLRRRRRHRKALTALLLSERADVVVSLYPAESSFLPGINDGSRKVLELHFCKFFRLQYGRRGLLGAIDRWRTWQDEAIVRRFDRFVVLTREDMGYWGALPNMMVIPNAARHLSGGVSDVPARRVIAVGRLDYQKGFDRLIQAWAMVQCDDRFHDWRLDIFGQGEWHDMLQGMINRLGLQGSARINKPTPDIAREYARSSILVVSSHYEGLPMVMIEAMTCGLPAVTFDCKCGPKDIIENGINGLLVKNGDICALAKAMAELMGNDKLRKSMSANAKKIVETYSEETVMRQWLGLFNGLTSATRQ